MADRYADLRAALDDEWVQSIHPDTVRTLLADYDRMRDALETIAAYPHARDQEMGAAAMRKISRAALAQEGS
ncbi:hypothetical protein ACMHYO_11580 [Allopusillimonas ginsengisoli]|uniref:hypothetical protein n=1 Tax=Allopusillimonas ginsengisoli TaxID=453575 RepID=UPI0039C261E6